MNDDDLDLRATALDLAIKATRPVPSMSGTNVHSAYLFVPLPETSKIIQTAAVFEAYLRNGAVQ